MLGTAGSAAPTTPNHADGEGVSITQRNNSAVEGFTSTYWNGWGKTKSAKSQNP